MEGHPYAVPSYHTEYCDKDGKEKEAREPVKEMQHAFEKHREATAFCTLKEDGTQLTIAMWSDGRFEFYSKNVKIDPGTQSSKSFFNYVVEGPFVMGIVAKMKNFLLTTKYNQMVITGELHGSYIPIVVKYPFELKFFAFRVMIDNIYLRIDEFKPLMDKAVIETVKLLQVGLLGDIFQKDPGVPEAVDTPDGSFIPEGKVLTVYVEGQHPVSFKQRPKERRGRTQCVGKKKLPRIKKAEEKINTNDFRRGVDIPNVKSHGVDLSDIHAVVLHILQDKFKEDGSNITDKQMNAFKGIVSGAIARNK